jgi:transcription initiation factor TFIID TATA-box-binding protein
MTIAMCNMTAWLGGRRLNIPALVAKLSATWRPSVFATATVRMRNPRCCILLFSTGKVVCTGARSEASAMRGLSKFISAIQHTSLGASLLNLRIELMTARYSLGYPVDLCRMNRENSMDTLLDQDLFPGLRWYRHMPSIDKAGEPCVIKITLLVFCNGNIVILGSKSRHQLLKIQDDFIDKLMPAYRCTVAEMIAYQEGRKRSRASVTKDRASSRKPTPAVAA